MLDPEITAALDGSFDLLGGANGAVEGEEGVSGGGGLGEEGREDLAEELKARGLVLGARVDVLEDLGEDAGSSLAGERKFHRTVKTKKWLVSTILPLRSWKRNAKPKPNRRTERKQKNRSFVVWVEPQCWSIG